MKMPIMRRKKRKSRFINLAEQLAVQNDIVNETMNSLLDFVSGDDDADQRSDWDEIQKTAGQPGTGTADASGRSIPRPKLTRTGTRSTRTV